MTDFTLVSFHLCPYVQRAAIALAEKSVPFTRSYVDLADKPDWFQNISPLGKVPLLLVGGPHGDRTVLFESGPILEYLEDITDKNLHPADPLERAKHRAWIEYGSAVLAAIWRFYSAADETRLASEAAGLEKMFARLEHVLADERPSSGPWFGGTAFSLVDTAFAPVFRYFDAFERIGKFNILENKPTIAVWRRELAAHASVRNAVIDDFGDRLDAFLAARDSALARRMITYAELPISSKQ